MNKLFLRVGLLLSLIPFMHIAVAYTPKLPENMTQGVPVRMSMPKADILTARAKFGDAHVTFFEVSDLVSDANFMPKSQLVKKVTASISTSKEQKLYTIYDLPKNHPEYTIAQKALGKGLLPLPSSGFLFWDGPVTRGEAYQILLRSGIPKQSSQAPVFNDLSPTDRTYTLARNAYEYGIEASSCLGLPLSAKLDQPLSYREGFCILEKLGYDTTMLREQVGLPKGATPTKSIPYLVAYIAPHRHLDKGSKPFQLDLVTKTGGKRTTTLTTNVQTRYHKILRYSIPADRNSLFQKEAQDQTWAKVDTARSKPHPTQLWEGTFIVPSAGTISQDFGDTMYINGVYQGTHFGIDYAVPTGSKIVASNTGIVTLSEYLPAFGHTIIIDHGLDIFTMYLHLSERTVAVGDKVTKGDLIGKVGNTGISSGPHLHFTFFVNDTVADNRYWYTNAK